MKDGRVGGRVEGGQEGPDLSSGLVIITSRSHRYLVTIRNSSAETTSEGSFCLSITDDEILEKVEPFVSSIICKCFSVAAPRRQI